ncbi:MAG: nucleotide exchange factor GrpE, partial [Candidatus Shapirobacteria bacterium]|nr:nucleotide exchange factor GrpE [Candidatus Shapirobacteria bacterium]
KKKKRIDKEKQSFVKYSNLKLLEKLLPILDDLERAEKHLKDQGLILAVNKLREILKSEGIEEIKALGEEFQPEVMEVIEMVEGPKNKVIDVTNKGYLIDDKILRVAKVKVGGGKTEERK